MCAHACRNTFAIETMSVLERTRAGTERRPLLSLAIVCAVSLGLGIVLEGSSGVLAVVGVLCGIVFFVAGLTLIVLVVRRATWKIGVAVVLAVMAGGAVLGIIESTPTSKSERAHIDKLQPKVGQYMAAAGRLATAKPHIRGRVVPVDVGDRKVDEAVYVRLPNALQARSPREVSTVVRIRYGRDVVGHYQTGDKAIRESATLTIVDLRSKKRYRGETIFGPEPPFTKPRTSGDQTGGPPDAAEIADYLTGLPRANAR